MLRVREDLTREVPREQKPVVVGEAAILPRGNRQVRLAALAALGLALGAGGAVFTVSLVQAEDDSGARAFLLQEAANRRAAQAPQSGVYSSNSASAYAPSRGGWNLPILRTQPDGRIAHPPINLNPFRTQQVAPPPGQHRPRPTAKHAGVKLDTVAGAGGGARTICVRLCDGFHAPIGFLRQASDMKAHEVLCQAMNPGLPVKVFRVAAGADTIDNAQSADGKRYGALPMAYSHEKSGDTACRPAIVQAGERRVSLLRDFTLRPGDSVVLDGKVRTFAGGSRWPYSTRDFRDFRSAAELSDSQRKQIDDRVGVSRMEAQARSLRRQMRLREASLQDDSVASDADDVVGLRGTLDVVSRSQVRIIPIHASETRP